ncbi:MAG TPA: hypothetical protein PKC76_12330 [Saprospiraceae bacterium]|nr:hypothetical protein [Saprospiraceae bacterium]HMP24915.1 hypothetical protein [Saprospiraceae bacterium]
MNIRQIKLALTVGLMNAQTDNNALNLVKELMLTFKEVGNFLGLRVEKEARLNPNHIQQTYALQFENCKLNLEVVSNRQTNSQYVQRFQLQ